MCVCAADTHYRLKESRHCFSFLMKKKNSLKLSEHFKSFLSVTLAPPVERVKLFFLKRRLVH